MNLLIPSRPAGHGTLSGDSLQRFVWALLLVAVASTPTSAQTVTDGRAWWNVTAQEKAGTPSPWRWYFEVQGRMRDGVGALDQLLIRPAVGYDLTPRASLWIGYGYTPSFPASGDVLTENRLWQQLSWTRPAGAATWALRSRLEQRALEGNDGAAVRARQQVRLTRPLPGGRVSAIVWDEVFVHLNSTRRTASGLDQNRVFGGVGVALTPIARLEVGYMNQYINSLSGPARSHHIVSGVLGVTF